MEYEKLRGLRESEEELAKVQAYIDKMIAKNIKKFQDEKKKQQLKVKEVEYHYPTLQELVRIWGCFEDDNLDREIIVCRKTIEKSVFDFISHVKKVETRLKSTVFEF